MARAWLLLALLLAGCMHNPANEPDGPDGEPTTSTTSATSSVSPSLPAEPPASNPSIGPANINLEGCTGWDAYWSLLPSSQVPTDGTPPGWERTDPTPSAGAGVVVLACGKVGVGPLERGPVTFMIDRHWNVDVPAECSADTTGGTDYSVLAKLYVDDPVVAEYLQATYGMPTANFTIRSESSAAGPIIQHDNRWSPADGPESQLTIVQDGTAVKRDFTYRLYWGLQNGLGRWQLNLQLENPEYSNRFGYGTFRDPMLMAQVSENFAGSADWFTSIAGSTRVDYYNDYLCEVPSF